MKQLILNFWTMLKRFRTSSVLNIVGLAVSFAALYIIAVQINHDFFYNHKLKDVDRIYRLEYPSWTHDGLYHCYSNRVIPANCISNIASVEACGTGNLWSWEHECSVSTNGVLEHYKVTGCRISLPILKIFEFKSIAGNVEDLAKPKTVAVSKSTADRLGLSVGDNLYFGITEKEENRYQVVAIYNDCPNGTDLSKVHIIYDMRDMSLNDEGNWSYCHYVKLLPGANNVEALTKQANENWKKFMMSSGSTETEADNSLKRGAMRFVPLKDVYFKTDIDVGYSGALGNRTTTYTLLAVAVLIVAIAFVNFINFFFALVPIRIRSINTRKVFGCSLFNLRAMLVFESFGLIAIGLAIAAIIVLYIENTSVAQLIAAPLMFNSNVGVAVFTVALGFVLALVASLYPAYYITSFPTAMVVKGSFGTSNAGRRLRYGLVGFQFAVSIALIICAIFVHMQHRFMMTYDMGFNKDMVLTTDILGKIPQNLNLRDAFDNKLKADPNIKDVAWASGRFVVDSRMGWGREINEKHVNFQCYPVSFNFLKFMGIKVEEGRDFLKSDENRTNGIFIFNMSAKKSFGLLADSKVAGHNGDTDIAGFCKDFNFRPLQNSIEPFAFYILGSESSINMPSHMYLRAESNANIESVIKTVRKAVADLDPSVYPESVDLQFFDQELQRNYEKEKDLSMLITLFSVLAIIISLMGVFGLVMFETQYRMKEIAVRRVHGASVNQVLSMFNVKFVKIVGVCFAIAVPISYCIINYWLGSYAYKVPIYWWVFVVSLLIVLAITVVTVTIRSYSAATSDPAKMVKSE